MEAILTDHSVLRANERLSLRKESLSRLANKALKYGLRHAQLNGKLKKCVSELWSKKESVNNCRIFGEIVFLFHDCTLLTLYQLPVEFKRVLQRYRRVSAKALQ